MDPYLEDPAFWPDFHRSFITYLRDALLDRLPETYDARIDEQLRLINYDDAEMQRVYPDVTVLHDRARRPQPPQAPLSRGVATIEPITVPAPAMAEVRDVWIEVRHRPDLSVVTIIEVLSPANKTGDGCLEYLAKRQGILARPVSVVEIDLLLGGRRLNFGPGVPLTSYATFISRSARRESVDVYGWDLKDRLPTLPIPLRPPDADVAMDLAEVFCTTYDRGYYARALQYGKPVPVGLGQADAHWVQERLREAGVKG